MVGTIIAGEFTLSSQLAQLYLVQAVLNGRAISLVSSVTMVNTIINPPANVINIRFKYRLRAGLFK
jgi:hypothetical protein